VIKVKFLNIISQHWDEVYPSAFVTMNSTQTVSFDYYFHQLLTPDFQLKF